MMELNKYDLVEWLISNIDGIRCTSCPISKECDNRIKRGTYPCINKEELRELLIKKYNL